METYNHALRISLLFSKNHSIELLRPCQKGNQKSLALDAIEASLRVN